MDKTIKENEHYLRNVKKNFTTSNMYDFALDYFEHFKDEYALNKFR